MASTLSKLIVLRGNSGSGKSTVAKLLREGSRRPIAIVEQDYLRRFVLKERETEGINNIGLIAQTVEYALGHGYDVVLEGILYAPRYGAMLAELAATASESYFFYFDISFDETLRRHATKSNRHDFGETEMRQWYRPRDLIGFRGEQIIPEHYSLEYTVEAIKQHVGL